MRRVSRSGRACRNGTPSPVLHGRLPDGRVSQSVSARPRRLLPTLPSGQRRGTCSSNFTASSGRLTLTRAPPPRTPSASGASPARTMDWRRRGRAECSVTRRMAVRLAIGCARRGRRLRARLRSWSARPSENRYGVVARLRHARRGPFPAWPTVFRRGYQRRSVCVRGDCVS